MKVATQPVGKVENPVSGAIPLVLATVAISADEPCLGLSEVNIQSPGSMGFHRYQVYQVMRNDRPAQFSRDLGPVDDFVGVGQFRIPGGVVDDVTGRIDIVHTAGELYDIAEYLRAGFVKPPEVQPRDLRQEAIDQAEEQQRRIKKASTFSRGVIIQRS